MHGQPNIKVYRYNRYIDITDIQMYRYTDITGIQI